MSRSASLPFRPWDGWMAQSGLPPRALSQHDRSRICGELNDLPEERRSVFDVFFSGLGNESRQAPTLHKAARLALADDALMDACYAYDRGRTEPSTCRITSSSPRPRGQRCNNCPIGGRYGGGSDSAPGWQLFRLPSLALSSGGGFAGNALPEMATDRFVRQRRIFQEVGMANISARTIESWQILRDEGPRRLAQPISRAAHNGLGSSDLDFPLELDDVADSRALNLAVPKRRPERGTPLTVGWMHSARSQVPEVTTTLFRMVEAVEAAGHTCVIYLYDRFRGQLSRHRSG